MKETRYFYVPDAEVRQELPSEEAAHATKVLRLKEGDEIMLMGNPFCESSLYVPYHGKSSATTLMGRTDTSGYCTNEDE